MKPQNYNNVVRLLKSFKKGILHFRDDLSKKNLVGAYFSGSHFVGTNFSDTDLSNAIFKDCIFELCNFKGTILEDTFFEGCSFDINEFEDIIHGPKYKDCTWEQ
ncbi:MAG: pentapeptide repeat-containing protein [Promethearchaeota archaeon]